MLGIKHAENNYSWWMKRLSLQLELFDVVRIDHFRGFNDYWSISTEHKDAKLGKWVKGPRLGFLEGYPRKISFHALLSRRLGADF